MRQLVRWALTIAAILFTAGTVSAHFLMLLPESPSAERDRAVAITFQWGHPFEHQLFDAPVPESIAVFAPGGQRTDLAGGLQKIALPGADGKTVTAYRLSFTPTQRGDHTFVLTGPPIWMEEEQLFLQDSVKVVLHVKTQNGWDAATSQPFELVPLTRPYGLRAGTVFQVQALLDGKPLAGAMSEVERYSPTPPKELPPDEQITRRVKSDPNGVITCTLPEPGWWCVSAERDGGKKERDGKMFPVRQRAIFWVFVDEPGKPSPR